MFFKVDAEKGEGKDLSDEFRIQGYPTFVLTNAEAETINRWVGYDDPASFIKILSTATADPTTIEEKIARFDAEPTAQDAALLGEYFKSTGEFLDAILFYGWAHALAQPDDGYEYEMFHVHRWGFQEDVFTADELVAAADLAVDSGRLTDAQYLRLAQLMSKTPEDGSGWPSERYVESALAATEGVDDPELLSARRHVLIEQALHITGDTDRALELMRETLDEGWEQDSGALNKFAWWCFENEVNLEEAESLARRGAELAEEAAEQAMILDTVAEIVFLRGDENGAAELMQQAVELDPDNDYYQEQLARFSGEEPNAM